MVDPDAVKKAPAPAMDASAMFDEIKNGTHKLKKMEKVPKPASKDAAPAGGVTDVPDLVAKLQDVSKRLNSLSASVRPFVPEDAARAATEAVPPAPETLPDLVARLNTVSGRLGDLASNLHKELGTAAPAAAAGGAAAKKAPKTSIAKAKPAPKLEETSKGWVIENYDDKKNFVLDVTMKMAVQIYNCDNCVVTLKGKLNSLIIDKCNRTAVVFDDAVSNVEIVNSKKAKVQCTGWVPQFVLDKVDGCTLYLTKKSDTYPSVISTLVQGLNIATPSRTEEDEMDEQPMPFQFETKMKDWKKGSWATAPTEGGE